MARSIEFQQYSFYPLTRVCSNGNTRWTPGRKAGQPSVIFIHTTEGSEGRTSAEDGASYDQRRTDGTSTHFFCDQDTTVQEVSTTDEAHAARAHGNDVGIQVELCGKAGQDARQWADAASLGTIEQAARLAVAIRAKYGKARFPLVNLTPAQLRAGGYGFAEHMDATLAWPEDGGTHTDPGPNFPWTKFFNRIIELEAAVAAVDLANNAANRTVFDDQLLDPAFFRADGGDAINFKEAVRQLTVTKRRITELATGIPEGTPVPGFMIDGRSIYRRLADIEAAVAEVLRRLPEVPPTA